MSSDLNVTTATFGTADLNGDTGDVFPSTVWTGLGDNTGYNLYKPRYLHDWSSNFGAPDIINGTNQVVLYAAAGTYTTVSRVFINALGANDGGTVKWNGTTILESAGTDGLTETTTGVIIDADSWVTLHYRTTGTMTGAAVFLRQTDD